MTPETLIANHISAEPGSVELHVEVTPPLAHELRRRNELVVESPLSGSPLWRRSLEWDGSGVGKLKDDVVLKLIAQDEVLT